MKNNIAKAMSLVFVLSIIAKVIAFIKSMIQASYYGATIQTDAYNMAFGMVSNILYMFTTAIAVAYVPLYIQKKTIEENSNNSYQFATVTNTALTFGAMLLTLAMELLAPIIIHIVAPGYEGEIYSDTVRYFRVLLVGFVFSLVSNVYQNILNSEKIYGYANFSSIINSIVLILIIVLFAEIIGIWALVIAVPVSYFCQFIVLYAKGHIFGRISLEYGIKDEAVRALALLAMPILLSQATVEINQVVDRALLSSVEDGAVTAVSYAAVLYQFALHVINIPISTVIFTELAEAGAKKNYDRVKKLLNDIYKIIVLICIPIMIVVVFLNEEIVKIVYGRGNFGIQAVSQTATGLLGYIFCLIPVIFKNVLTRAYYGFNDTKGPMIISLFEVMLNIVLSIILVKYFGIIGIVGATAIASIVFIVVLMIDFEKRYFRVIHKADIEKYWKIVLACMVSIAIMIPFCNMTFGNVYIDFAAKSILVFGTYLIVLLLLQEEQVIHLATTTINRIKI